MEDAAARVIPDWRINSFADCVSRPDWGLLKLHGSISWSRVAPNPADKARDDSNSTRAVAAADLAHDGNLPFRAQNAIRVTSTDKGEVLFPAIAVPLANKTTF